MSQTISQKNARAHGTCPSVPKRAWNSLAAMRHGVMAFLADMAEAPNPPPVPVNAWLISTFRSIGFPNRPFGVYDIQLCPDTMVSQDADCIPDTVALVAYDNYFMPQ